MSVVQVPSHNLEPELQVQVPTQNSSGPKALIQVYPIESGSFGVLNTSANGRLASFSISSQTSAICFPESYFSCNIALSTTGSIPGDVSSLIERVQIQTESGTQILDTAAGHNLWGRVVDIITVNPGIASTPVPSSAQACWESGLENLLQPDAGQTVITSTAVDYSFKLSVPFLQQNHDHLLPVSGGLRIILTFASDYICLYQNGTSAGKYLVSNLFYNAVYKPLNPEYVQRVKAVANENGIVVPYTQPLYMAQPLPGSSNSITINYACKWAKGLVSVVRKTTNFASNGYSNLDQYLVPVSGLSQIQLTNGSNLYPQMPITKFSQQYRELKKLFKVDGKVGWAGNGITRSRYCTASYVSGANQCSTGPLNITGIDMSTDDGAFFTGASTQNGTFVYQFNMIAAAAANSQLDMWLLADYALVCRNPQSSVVLGG